MVYVRLDSEWTDGNGVHHSAGEMVDVDAATLAGLQAEGIVSEVPSDGKGGPAAGAEGWVGPGSSKP